MNVYSVDYKVVKLSITSLLFNAITLEQDESKPLKSLYYT